jgi:hypothetical protein
LTIETTSTAIKTSSTSIGQNSTTIGENSTAISVTVGTSSTGKSYVIMDSTSANSAGFISQFSSYSYFSAVFPSDESTVQSSTILSTGPTTPFGINPEIDMMNYVLIGTIILVVVVLLYKLRHRNHALKRLQRKQELAGGVRASNNTDESTSQLSPGIVSLSRQQLNDKYPRFPRKTSVTAGEKDEDNEMAAASSISSSGPSKVSRVTYNTLLSTQHPPNIDLTVGKKLKITERLPYLPFSALAHQQFPR